MSVFILILQYLATCLFILGQYGRVSFLNQNINIYIYEVFLAILFLMLLVRYHFAPIVSLKKQKRPFLLLLITFSASFVISIFSYGLLENIVAFLYLGRLFFYITLFYYLLSFYKEQKKHIKKQIIILGIGTSVMSILQFFFYPNLRNLMYEGWDPHQYRIFGSFLEPYLSASFFGLSIIFVYFRVNKNKLLKYILLVVFLLFLFLTYSRISYIAIIMTTIGILIKEKKAFSIGFIFLFFAIMIIISPKYESEGRKLIRTFSIVSRFENMEEGIRIWANHPILGIGYNHIRYERIRLKIATTDDLSHAVPSFHSSFVTILATTGVVGFLSYLFFLFSWTNVSPVSRWYILFISIVSCGDNALLHPFILFVLLLLLIFESSYSSFE